MKSSPPKVLRCFLELLAVTVAFSGLANGQALQDVVAPVGVRTLVRLSAPRDSQLSVQKGSFKGSAEIISDPPNARYSLIVVPDQTEVPTELSIVRQNTVLQKIRVYPVFTQPEEWTIESRAALPDATSREYTTVTQASRASQGVFNGIERTTLRTMKISGYRVVIEPGVKQGTYERLMPGGINSPPQDLASVEIYAKEVIIGSPLRLPGTTVKIYAESLEFQDKPNSTAQLDVTPLPQQAQTDKGASGLNGQNSADIFLYLSRPFADVGKVRLIARGAPGQQGGPATDAVKGRDLPWLERDGPGRGQIGGISRSWGTLQKNIHNPLPPGWGQSYDASVDTVWFKRNNTMEFGDGSWPGDATPGKGGGVPGIGGAGGQVHSSVMVSGLNVTGGDAGAPRDPAARAEGGKPRWAVGVWIEPGRCRSFGSPREGRETICDPAQYHFYSRRSSDAGQVPSPEQSVKIGSSGTATVDLNGWFHPLAGRARLRYAEDLYRLGLLTEAEKELKAIAAAANAAGGATNPDADYLSAVERTNSLLVRLSSNLDYFGHPGGWAPLIDFPTTWNLLQAEVKSIAPILIATEQVRIQAEAGAANKADLEKSRESALNQMKQAEQNLRAYSEEIPRLEAEAASIAQDETALKNAIQLRETQLTVQAEDETRVGFLKGALRTLSAVASVLPVGQPIVGAVGGALNFLSTIDERTPWESINELPSIAQGFSRQNISTSVQNYHGFLNDVKSFDPNNPTALYSKISSAANVAGRSLAEFKKLQDASRVPQSEVEAVLQRLKAQDPSLQEWVSQVGMLATKKEAFQKRMDADMQMVGELTSQMTSQAERVDTLTSVLVSAQDAVDHPAIVAAQEISRSLRDRLDLYHYLFLKAYEYYTAKPYDGNRNPGLTADSFAAFLKEKNNDPRLAGEALEAVYTAAIQDAGGRIMLRLAEDGGPAEQVVTLVLNPSEIAKLNSMLTPGPPSTDSLFINLENRGIFRTKDLDARLVNAEVAVCDCEKASGPPGSVRFTIDVTTQNFSVVRTTSDNLGFRLDSNAIPWGASVDLSSGQPVTTQSKVPEDVGQVIARITGSNAPRPYATAPPLYPGISIKAVPLFDDQSGATQIRINRLNLKLTYTYRVDREAGARAIRVTYSGTETTPFFYVGLRDDRQLQHGLGSFSRLYHDRRIIEIVAPQTVGAERFDGWYLLGSLVERSNHLQVPDNSNSYSYEARYRR
jgi:hypothetical protein